MVLQVDERCAHGVQIGAHCAECRRLDGWERDEDPKSCRLCGVNLAAHVEHPDERGLCVPHGETGKANRERRKVA